MQLLLCGSIVSGLSNTTKVKKHKLLGYFHLFYLNDQIYAKLLVLLPCEINAMLQCYVAGFTSKCWNPLFSRPGN